MDDHERRPGETGIGSLDWLRRSAGRLSVRERLRLSLRAALPTTRAMLTARIGREPAGAITLADLPTPDSQAVREALQAVEQHASDGVLQHSLRCYAWASGLGRRDRLAFDPELLLVSCLLHDLGMTPRFNGHAPGCACFAGQGALAALQMARAWGPESGWHEARCIALADAIALHMNGHVPPSEGIEAHLLQQSTAYDVIGARWRHLPAAFRAEVLARHPDRSFGAEFTGFLQREAKQRPQSRAALMLLLGVPLLVRLRPRAPADAG
jgi:hypothetical protein